MVHLSFFWNFIDLLHRLLSLFLLTDSSSPAPIVKTVLLQSCHCCCPDIPFDLRIVRSVVGVVCCFVGCFGVNWCRRRFCYHRCCTCCWPFLSFVTQDWALASSHSGAFVPYLNALFWGGAFHGQKVSGRRRDLWLLLAGWSYCLIRGRILGSPKFALMVRLGHISA